MSAIAAPSMSPLFIFIFIFSFITLFTISSCSHDDLVSDLISLQSQSESGVIRLNDRLLSRFITSSKPPRAFSLLIFFDANQLRDKSELNLKVLRNEFALLASSFITNNKENPSSRSTIFFCDIEFKESQSSFQQFGVNSLPHIRLVPTTAARLKDDSIQMGGVDPSSVAESMAQFVESRTNAIVGPIHRPPVLSKKQIAFCIVALLLCIPFAIKKVIAGETLLHDRKIWLVGAIFVYFVSVSGGMYNIIRKMPMFMADRNDPSKLIFFYQGSDMQLGAEGFTVGFLYTIVGLLLAVVIHLLVKVKNVNLQRGVMFFAIIVSFLAVKKVIELDGWKTGYAIHMYWPSGWL
ncbi:probable dolichyl-diphosphooligosaccharide--protein glycosyltransferase subunit 3B [Impatiens glandulifera]|uniref:probable dolichyl-diphosphooligosaccharide--protein glycosyltransferase subunit 3B n=1 Tax=Impatiens glandulifera TaxID=253017 RepID=UPI001FB0550C|nr:probable dolichyl-diphosphooligosaccharide--protein glycosyltransferase subunit 3B [Impatiens glandulifera]